jgi:hypothetical protein
LQADPLERLAQHASVERGVVGDQQATAELLGEDRQHLLQRRSALHHLLADAGQAPDAAPERSARAHK